MHRSLDLGFLRQHAVGRRSAFIVLAGAALGILYALLAPRWYTSVLTVVPAKQQRSGFSSLLAGAELGALAAGLTDAASADVARIAAVLQSTAVSDAVIEKFDLRDRYRERYQETARDALWRHCDVKTLSRANMVQLACEDRDPRFAQGMVAFFAEYGNEVFRRVSVSSATEEVRFLEKHVAELRQQADHASTRMREFQERHQIVDLDSQSKAVVSALATLNAQRIAKQLELRYARTFSARDEASLLQLESQLAVMDQKIRDLQQARPAASRAAPAADAGSRRPGQADSGLFPPALEVPRLRAEFEDLYRDRRVSEATLVFALERLEAAKASEARDVSTFVVLDPPTVPTKHTRPKRLASGLVGLAAGLAAAAAWEGWRRFRASPPSTAA